MMHGDTALAFLITTFVVNTKCVYIFHQPNQNENVKSLRKF